MKPLIVLLAALVAICCLPTDVTAHHPGHHWSMTTCAPPPCGWIAHRPILLPRIYIAHHRRHCHPVTTCAPPPRCCHPPCCATTCAPEPKHKPKAKAKPKKKQKKQG